MIVNRVLLIDDDKDDAQFFKEALVDLKPLAEFFWLDGCEAVGHILGNKVPLPDIIFLDVNMPSLSGWDCLKTLKQTLETMHVPVIMYTTSSRESERQIARKLGAMDFVTKPNDYQSLFQILSSIFDK